MRKINFESIILLIVSIFLIVKTYISGFFSSPNWYLSEYLFIFMLGFVLLILSSLSIVSNKNSTDKRKYTTFLIPFIIIFLYVVLIDKVNFILLTSAFIFILSYLFGYKKPVLLFIVSVSSSLVMYYIFIVAFKVMIG
ncbi:MAG: hypothetical protein CSB16_02525 [Clostridiales bacterium]|nr:MAG: hypothetical protein CSB16_02525 [Clostridiales bacterium]